jgi:hypothetical protein
MNDLQEYGERHNINWIRCLNDGRYEINFCGIPHFMPQTFGPGEEPYEFLQPRLQLKPGEEYVFRSKLPDASEIQ